MNEPALLLVGHGSTDPRHAASLRRLAGELRQAGVPRVTIGFLDHCTPTVTQALAELAAPAPHQARRDPVRVLVQPLFLATAYHVQHDVPSALRAAVDALPATVRRRVEISTGPALGPDPLLRAAMAQRLRGSGVRPDDGRTGLVLGAAGTSDRDALAGIAAEAHGWHHAGWHGIVPAYASTAAPDAARAVGTLLRRGATRVAVASYFLAPGMLHDRLTTAARAAGASVIAEPLCTPRDVAPALLRLVLARLDPIALPQRASA